MTQATPTSPRHQCESQRDQLGKPERLPFLKILSRALVEQTCRLCNHPWRERIYIPWITRGIFLSQIRSEDHSGDDAVERFPKFRSDQDLPAGAPESSRSCQARQRWPEELTGELVRRTGQSIHRQAKNAWLVQGRSVQVIDGSTGTMPDTLENPAASPQRDSQAPGVGFPIARLLVVFRRAVGTVLEARLGPYQGQQTSVLALLRQVLAQFQPGDIVLADRFFGSSWVIAVLQTRGVGVVVRLHQARVADFRRGRRRGREDHLVTGTKPQHVPGWMSRAESEAMPAPITVRERRVRVRDRTKRVRKLVIVTTLAEGATSQADERRSLFRPRWPAELDLRTLKTAMAMEMGRTKSPEMVRQEVAVHLLASNLIRGIMAEAARVGEVKPRRLSFKGALHTVRSFEESYLSNPTRIEADLPRLLEWIGKKRVGARPDRYEPRAVKRRPKPNPVLKIPREAAKRLIKRGIILDKKG